MERTLLLSIDCKTGTIRRYVRGSAPGRVICLGKAEAHSAENLAALAGDAEGRKQFENFRLTGN